MKEIEQTEQIEKQIQEIEQIVNLTGRNLTIVLPDKTRLFFAPAGTAARAHQANPEEVGEGQLEKYAIPLFYCGPPVVYGLPQPKKGIVYVVKEPVARHPFVRRRSDVFHPRYVAPGSETATGLIRG